MPRMAVKLELALVWKCPHCATRLFHPGKPVRDPEIIEDANQDLGSFEAGELWEAPSHVHCPHCDEVFDVLPMDDESEE